MLRRNLPPSLDRPRAGGLFRRLLLVALGFLMVFGGCGLCLVSASKIGRPSLKDRQFLDIAFAGEIREAPTSPLDIIFSPNTGSLHDFRATLGAAASDDRVTGVLLNIGPLQAGFGAIEDARAAITEFRKSGKTIEAFVEVDSAGELELFLATATSHVTVTPHTGIAFDGLAAEVGFYRGMLDKLRVTPEFIQYHEYKSAAEPFSRHDMSSHMRESMNFVLAGIWRDVVEAVARDRGLEPAALARFADGGLTTAARARDLGLIDRLGYRDHARDHLRNGDDSSTLARADASSPALVVQAATAGLSDDQNEDASNGAESTTDFVSQSTYLEVIESAYTGAGPAIAVVYGEGQIVTGGGGGAFGTRSNVFSGKAIAAQIRAAVADERVRGIVLRINSPGGSAVGSDLVWREVMRAKAAGKPVVASMSGVAASGGYWVAMAADSIIAAPTTITGSIGVVFGKFDVSGFGEWVGIHHEVLTHGKHADLMSGYRKLTPEREAVVRRWLDETYAGFVSKVARGRNLPREAVAPHAKGRIWTGRQALERKLVDGVGGFDRAVARCRELSDIADDAETRVIAFPEKKTLVEEILDMDVAAVRQALTSTEQPESLERLQRLAAQLERVGVWALAPEVTIR